MSKVKLPTTDIVYANYHTPVEHRSIVPSPLDELLSNQPLIHLKRIVFLYLSQLPTKIPSNFMDSGIEVYEDRILINPNKLAYKGTLQRSNSYYNSLYSRLQEDVIESFNVTIRKNNPKSEAEIGQIVYDEVKANYFNVIELTPTMQNKLTGRVENFKSLATTLIESVKHTSSYVEIKMSSFLIQVRERIKKEVEASKSALFSHPELIPVDINELRSFRSSYAIQLYLLIAKNQFFSNKLVISLDDLRSYLGFEQRVSTNEFLRYFKKHIIGDPGLMKSTCAISPIENNLSGKKKLAYWFVAKRNKQGIQAIELRFKNNEELKQLLLNLNYSFINHLKSGTLNEATLIQIIKRVHDGILKENYVNYCINKAYQTIERTNKQNDKTINAATLAWTYLSSGDYKDAWEFAIDLQELSQPVGISITKYKSDHKQVELFKETEVRINDSGHDASFWSYIESSLGFSDANIYQFTRANISQEMIHNSLSLNKDENVATTVKRIALDTFITIYKKELVKYIKGLGFDQSKANLFIMIMPEDLKISFFNFYSNGKLDLPKDGAWPEIIKENLLNCLDKSIFV